MAERYHPDSEQVAFTDSVGKSLLSILTLSRLHQSLEESSQVWADLQNLGVFAISTPEQEGGSALGATEEALIVLELGRRAVAPSISATVGAAHLLRTANRQQPSADHKVAAGYRRGERVVFVEDDSASSLLVREPSGAALFAYPTSSRSLDEQLWSCRLRDTDMLGERLAEATSEQVLRLRLLDAALLAGIARAALDMSVEYAKLREQFGRPIGTFQAVKHHCANMAIAARQASDLVSFAAVAVDDARADAGLQVESALYVASTAALDNCGKNIQIHGGMGFSDEADPHRLLKRARVYVEIAGGLEAALARIAACPSSAEVTERDRRSRQ
jgi:alkylation response protein AidB-like acyl-CoA dehydrogenase